VPVLTNQPSKPPLLINCPRCAKAVEWTAENSFRPFCSDRCKLIDLGEWAAEEKIIPGEPLETGYENDDTSFLLARLN
jgi:uncharacterized protein